MRIIFVGIHNKVGKEPLDSSTKSGEIIDKIIAQLDYKCEKTNLFDLDYLPKHLQCKFVEEWFWTNLPTKDDIVILLGKAVQKEFNYNINTNILEVPHPARANKNYIQDVVNQINSINN